MLIQRIITALVVGSLTIIGVFYLPPMGFDLLVLLTVGWAAWEYSALFKEWNYQDRVSFLSLLFIMAILVTYISPFPILIVSVIWWLMTPYLLRCYMTGTTNYFTSLFWQLPAVHGAVIFVSCWVGLTVIRKEFGIDFLLYLLALVWAADIGAYFTGIFWRGRKKLLAPEISPKKTVQGLLGGVLLALLIAITGIFLLKFDLAKSGATRFGFSSLNIVSLFLLSIVVCLWSVIGDLFESVLKRRAAVKDSGILLPGHGGMYDRIDSLLAAVPIFILGLLLIN